MQTEAVSAWETKECLLKRAYSVDVFHIHEHQHAATSLLLPFLFPDFSWQRITAARRHSGAQGTTRADDCCVAQHPVTENEQGKSGRKRAESFKAVN